MNKELLLLLLILVLLNGSLVTISPDYLLVIRSILLAIVTTTLAAFGPRLALTCVARPTLLGFFDHDAQLLSARLPDALYCLPIVLELVLTAIVDDELFHHNRQVFLLFGEILGEALTVGTLQFRFEV